MSTRGKDRSVSDAELIKAIKHHPDPAVKSTELAEQLPLTSTRINELLKSLESEGILKKKSFGSANGWWVARVQELDS
jgi:DNA-binding IclR family transcriptional regulator